MVNMVNGYLLEALIELISHFFDGALPENNKKIWKKTIFEKSLLEDKRESTGLTKRAGHIDPLQSVHIDLPDL